MCIGLVIELCPWYSMFRHCNISWSSGIQSTFILIIYFILIYQYLYLASFIILYNGPTNAHNNFTNYHTATCFDTIVSSSGSLQSIPCQVTPVFQMQVLVILFCTMDQQMHTIISQIITPLHVSTLSCHPQTVCNQYLAKLHQYIPASTTVASTYRLYIRPPQQTDCMRIVAT